MENSGLTPSEFADKIGVQRSAISHLTSGRNNPSLDFLIKIKTEFPEIDTDWLIFGTEKTVHTDEIPAEKVQEEKTEDFRPTLFDDSDFEPKAEETESKTEIEKPENIKNESHQIVRTILIYEDGSFEDFVRK